MRYLIIVSCPKLSTAKKAYDEFSKSKVYNSKEIMKLNRIKEVCDDCVTKYI
jgi:hypothetical protein